MVNGGFSGPSGRRGRRGERRDQRVERAERALSASALLPTAAFAALGTVTVLLVSSLGMSPLGSVTGDAARDGGLASALRVTTPRITIDSPRELRVWPESSRGVARVPRVAGPTAAEPARQTPVETARPDLTTALGELTPAEAATTAATEPTEARSHGKAQANGHISLRDIQTAKHADTLVAELAAVHAAGLPVELAAALPVELAAVHAAALPAELAGAEAPASKHAYKPADKQTDRHPATTAIAP